MSDEQKYQIEGLDEYIRQGRSCLLSAKIALWKSER
jgi:hypothetical protein